LEIVFEDKNLSFRDRGIFFWMWSQYPEVKLFKVEDFKGLGQDGVGGVATSIRSLGVNKYINFTNGNGGKGSPSEMGTFYISDEFIESYHKEHVNRIEEIAASKQQEKEELRLIIREELEAAGFTKKKKQKKKKDN
jgi:hypothetical protein